MTASFILFKPKISLVCHISQNSFIVRSRTPDRLRLVPLTYFACVVLLLTNLDNATSLSQKYLASRVHLTAGYPGSFPEDKIIWRAGSALQFGLELSDSSHRCAYTDRSNNRAQCYCPDHDQR